jgi:hypothetical protein
MKLQGENLYTYYYILENIVVHVRQLVLSVTSHWYSKMKKEKKNIRH